MTLKLISLIEWTFIMDNYVGKFPVFELLNKHFRLYDKSVYFCKNQCDH